MSKRDARYGEQRSCITRVGNRYQREQKMGRHLQFAEESCGMDAGLPRRRVDSRKLADLERVLPEKMSVINSCIV
uniref:Uncharacterized protein n=1 Tax=Ditylenchus dipsaci TaxID=166011 RepID=A0A915CMW1_9BILA